MSFAALLITGLNYSANRVLTANIFCNFGIDLPSCDLKRKQDKFILQYISTVDGFCQFCKKL